MLKMGRVQDIRQRVLVEGRSIRWTAREMGISRNTIRRYLKESEPRRGKTGGRPRPVLLFAPGRLDWLPFAWGTKTTAQQRLTGSRLHHRLLDDELPHLV